MPQALKSGSSGLDPGAEASVIIFNDDKLNAMLQQDGGEMPTAVPSRICYTYHQRIGYPTTFGGSL
jgi:hypothetical protein